MPLITETYYLSLTQDNRGILRLRCSQDDTLRTVNLKLYNNGSIFVIPSGVSASVSGVKQNGAVFSKPCTISQNRESVVLQLSSDITNVDGIIVAEVVLNDGEGGRLGTSNFIIQVEKNPIRAGVVQDTETPIEYINDFIEKIQTLTARLNNLITPSGDASLAEVVDARIGVLDSTTYQTLGARLNAEFQELSNALNGITILESTGDTTDRTSAILSKLNAYGTCKLGKGDFYVSSLVMPEGSHLVGSGKSTRVILPSSITNGYIVKPRSNCIVENVSFYGGFTGTYSELIANSNAKRHCIILDKFNDVNSENVILSNIFINNFVGSAIVQRATNRCHCKDVVISMCYAGIDISNTSYDGLCTNVYMNDTRYGVVQNGSNFVFSGCISKDSQHHIMSDQQNTECTFSSCTFFDSSLETTSVLAYLSNARNGFVFDNCMFDSSLKMGLNACDGIVIKGTNFVGSDTFKIIVSNGRNTLLLITDCIADVEPTVVNAGTAARITSCYLKDGTAWSISEADITVDGELSDESENPVQNKVINRAIGEIKADLKNALNDVYEHSVTETLVTPVGDTNGITFVLFDIKAGHTYEIVADVLNKNSSIIISTRNTTSGDTVEAIDTHSFSDPVRFVPQYDAKMFRVVTKATGTITVTEKTSLEGLLDYVDANAEEINEINETILADDSLNDNLSDGYIRTNGSVGSTVTLTKVPSSNIISVIIACNENDVFTVTGSGASNGRLWCFVDESYKIISHANASVTETNKVLTAPDDGYLIINVNKGSTYSIRKKVMWIDAINNQYGTVKLYDNVTVENVQIKKQIATNAGIGQTISTSASDSSVFSSFTIAVAVNDEFYLYGFGGNTPRLWCLTDSNYVCQSVAGISVNALETPQHFKAPTSGYLIVNYINTDGFTLLKRRDANSISTIEENYQNIAKVKETLPILEDSIANVSNIPLVHFNLNDYQLKDVSDYRDLVDYDSAGRDPMLKQFYDLFDSLVTNYSDYVSRVDAAELVDLSYPSYANGVSGSSTYEDTPAYKTYMYKFIDTNLGAGNEAKNVKRKLLLICGTHGNEVMTPFNAFVFASELCKAIDSNYFKLRVAFDVYIIPCLNGYGMYHNQRPNADWIDINRNFPTSTWHVDGADTIGNKNTCVYTGTEAGSTFECQLIMALQDKLSPEFVIDHHNYSGGDSQFYTNVDNTLYLRLVHQSAIDCSFAFVNGLPAYFGSDYKLIIPNRNVTFAPRQTEDNLNGKMVVWLTEHGTLFPCTIEIASDIRFLGGENTQSYNNWAGSDTFCVAEYTLRNQILTYGQYVLNRDALI